MLIGFDVGIQTMGYYFFDLTVLLLHLLPQRLADREKLPITSMAGDIVGAVHKNNVIVVKGSTGCGKTTQVCDLCVVLILC